MKCPTCQTPLQYGVCSTCKEEKYLRDEREAIQATGPVTLHGVWNWDGTKQQEVEPYWEPGIYKGET